MLNWKTTTLELGKLGNDLWDLRFSQQCLWIF